MKSLSLWSVPLVANWRVLGATTSEVAGLQAIAWTLDKMRLKDVPRVHQVPRVVVNLLHDLKLELVGVTFLRQPYCPHRQRGLKSNSQKTGESTKWFSIKLRFKFWALTLRTTQRAKTRYRRPWMARISCERARLSSLPSPCLWMEIFTMISMLGMQYTT